jgi:hypothetical protein
MRAPLVLSTIALVAIACGEAQPPTAPPPSELQLLMTANPVAVPGQGLRSSTVISVLLVEPGSEGGVLQSAVLTVRDAQGTVLARETVTGPIFFERGASIGLQQAVAWEAADVFGRSLEVLLSVGTAPANRVIQRTVTF